MTGSDFLFCIAQVGITVTGFAGLIGVFRPLGAQWLPQDIRGVNLILHYSLGAVFFSLLPFPLSALLQVEPRVWAICSSLLATVLLVEVLWQLYNAITLTRVRLGPRRPEILYPILIGSLIIIGLAFYGAYSGGTQTIYETALLWLLTASVVQFLVFVGYFGSPESFAADRGLQHTAQPDAAADTAERRL